ncbi:thioredoxin family protein [Rhodobacteraceae bacterium NNCM2]|nr:thioredoxin family protein [Coraliihabitans acroporae]
MRFLLALIFALTAAGAQAVEIGEDGLHKQPWFAVTFKDMTEDLEDASAAGKRLAVIFEQRGCTYCQQMHEQVFADPKIADYIQANYVVVQMNLFGDEEVTDFDGESLSEKEMARRWGVVFTPTILFMPEEPPAEGTAAEAAVAVMPGAFGKSTSLHMFQWVVENGYESGEHFQKYHARKFNAGE